MQLLQGSFRPSRNSLRMWIEFFSRFPAAELQQLKMTQSPNFSWLRDAGSDEGILHPTWKVDVNFVRSL